MPLEISDKSGHVFSVRKVISGSGRKHSHLIHSDNCLRCGMKSDYAKNIPCPYREEDQEKGN